MHKQPQAMQTNKPYNKISHWLKECISPAWYRREEVNASWNRYLGRQLTAASFPTRDQRGESDHWSRWDARIEIQQYFYHQALIPRVAGATTHIIDMAKFSGERTCTPNMTEYPPDTYNEITHSTLASMLQEENYFQRTHTIQIPKWHKYASIGFTQRDILEQLCETEHLLADTYIKFEPDY